MLSFLLILIGIIGLIWFMIPFYTKRIMNIGNGTGIIISILLIVLGAFHDNICQLLATIPRNSVAHIILIIFAIVLAVCLCLAVCIALCICLGKGKRSNSDATVIVLGCRVYGNKASLMLEERLYAALSYLQDHPTSNVVVAGGKGYDEGISEAKCMQAWLIEHDIAANRIYMENKSTTTHENLTYSFEIIDANSLSHDVAIVSNEFHIYRALKLAKQVQGNRTFNCYGISAKTAWWLFPTYFTREIYAILAMWLHI